MPKKMLLFDIDGTLLLTGGAGRIAFERAVEEIFGLAKSWGKIVPDGKTDPLIIEELLRELPVPPTPRQYDLLCTLYHDYFEQEIETVPGFRLMPGIPALIERLKVEECLVLGIATGNFKRAAELKLRKARLDRYFDFGGYGCDGRNRIDLTQKAIERGLTISQEKIDPGSIYVIGDTVHDIAAGKAVGARTIAVATGSTTMETLSSMNPDWAFEDFGDMEKFLSVVLDENPSEN